MDERDLLAALAAAIVDGRVMVSLDYGPLFHNDSPIFVESERNWWIYGIAVASAAAWFLGRDWRLALAALAVGLAGYFGLGRPVIRRRMRARFLGRTVNTLPEFKKLWRSRGVVLTLAPDRASCASPDGDWRRFALTHLCPPRPVPA